jgi:hypothetical protein
MKYLKSFLNFFKKTIIFIFIFILSDIVFFALIPSEIKSKLYNNRAHRIKSYYYHHDLRPMASFYDHWGYERYKIYTNSLGFKDEFNRKVKFKNKNILFIGDSFTEGVGVRYEDTYVGLIDKHLKKNDKNVEILNAGVQSYSTSIYLSKIYHLIERKKLPITDIVIMISGGDFYDDNFKYLELNEDYVLNHIDQKNKIMIKIINFYKSNTLTYQFLSRITPPKVIPQLIKSIFESNKTKTNYDEKEKELLSIRNNEIDQIQFFNSSHYAYLYSIEEFDLWGKKAIDKSLYNLKQIIELTEKNEINLNIFYLYEPVIFLKKPNKKQFDYLINSLENLKKTNVNVNFIRDVYKEFENPYEAYKSLFFIGDIHWNKKGNKKVSEEILNKIDLN